MRYFLLSCLMALTSLSFAKERLETAPGKPRELFFLENKGQITDQNRVPRTDIDFKLSGSGLNVFVGDGQIHYQFTKMENAGTLSKAHVKSFDNDIISSKDMKVSMYRLDVTLLGANINAPVVTEDEQEYYEAYYLNGLGENGATAHAFKKITYKDVYPNIDWVLFAKDGKMKYEFVVRPGGNPADIKLKFAGATKLSVEKDGGLSAVTPMGTIAEDAPYSYEAETKRNITSAFKLNDNILSFETGTFTGTLVIDPVLAWSTFYGDTGFDLFRGMTSDAAGNVYSVGTTTSSFNIATSGTHQSLISNNFGPGFTDGMVVKFSPAGARLWATYYGGTGDEEIRSITSDASGNIYVTGHTTSSSGIATTGSFGGLMDGFLVKFNSSGVRQWGIYIGGTSDDILFGVALDASNNIYVSGRSASTSGISTFGAHQASNNSIAPASLDGILVKYNNSGVKQWGTYYGGSEEDGFNEVKLDASGNVYVCGMAFSASSIASTGAYQTVFGGIADAMLVKFNSSGVRQWGTYYGGSNDEGAFTIGLDASANPVIGGYTASLNAIATTNAMQGSIASPVDGYVAKFNTSGSLQWGTYFGGDADEEVDAILADASGNIYLAGFTFSIGGFPTYNQWLSFNTTPTTEDGFLAKLNASGSLLWSTAFGDTGGDNILALDLNGPNLHFAGATNSTINMASTGAYQTTSGGGVDGFITKVDTANAILACDCPFAGTQYPNVTFTPTTAWQTAATDIFAGEYSVYNVVAGNTYEWSYCFVDGGNATYDTKLNLYNGSGVYITCNDDFCGLQSKIAWTATFTGTVRVLTSEWTQTAACSTNTNGSTLRFRTTGTACLPPAQPGTIAGNALLCASVGGAQTYLVPIATGVTSYTWTLPTGWIGSSTTNSITVTPGTTGGTISVTANNACGSSTPRTLTVTINTPTATITAGGATTFCSGNSVVLNANTGVGYTYQWKQGGIDIPGATNSTHTVTASGSYTVVVTVAPGCSATSLPTVITVNTTPSATITAAGPTTFCSGGSVVLNANTGAGLTYQWLQNGGTITGATNASYTANTAGSYTVIVTGAGGCSATSAPTTVTVNTAPTATITTSGATTFCSGNSVTLNANTGTGYTYQWQNSSGPISGATNSSYVATTSGSYTVVVTAGANCSATSTATVVTVNPTPSATVTASGPTSFCSGGSVTLNASSGAGYTYQWSQSGGPIGGATNASYTATTSGSYTVTVTSGSCSATSIATTVTVNTTPTATVSASGATTFCSGGSVTLSATTGTGYTYQWQQGTTAIGGATNSSYTATTSGSYSVVVTSGACAATSTPITVTVNPAPTATITAAGPTTFCTGGNVLLNANTGTGLTYQWQLNGGSITGANGASYTASTAGSYTVIVTNAGNCSTTSSAVTVIINTAPTATVTPAGPTTFCAGGNVLLNANTGIGLSYQWKLNGTDIPGANGTGYTATATGSYTVEVTSGTCATLSSSVSVTVTPGPANLTASSNSPVCVGSPINLTATSTSTGVTYSWAGPGSYSATGATPSIASATTANAGTYTVTGTVNGCTSTATTTVVISNGAPAQPASITGAANICANSTQVYSIPTVTGASSYTWTLPSGWTGTSTTNTITVTPNATGGIISVVANNGCGISAAQTISVSVSPTPTATIVPAGSVQFCAGGSVVLDATNGAGLTYQWQSNGGNISGATNASYTATQSGDYTVIISNGTCSATSSIMTVTVNPVPTSTATAAGPTTFCAGGNVTLQAGAATGVTYQWLSGGINISGATNATYVATASGTYSLVMFNSGSCSDTSADIVVTVNALPTVTISQSGGVVTASGTFTTYQWYLNGAAITGATNQSYTPTQSGQYHVEVTNANNCSGESNTLSFTVGVRTIALKADVKLYPNPNAGIFTVEGRVDAKDGTVTLQVIDVTGKVQHSEEVTIANGKITRQVSLRDLAAGLYMVKLIAAEGVLSLPFVKD